MGLSNDTITEALLNIYQKTVDVKDQIEPNLFRETLQTLNLAVDEGFGKVSFGNPDFDFVHELKYNNAVFSAFKVHREQNDIALQLLDDKGNLKSFSKFKKDAAHIPEQYQKWMDTEYNTAVLRARQASNFKKYQRDADLFPNLKWLQSTSVDKREGHVKLYGTIRPINDPFWKEHYPGNLWNCKCGITNTDEPATGDVADVDYTPAPGLDENPAFSAALFSKSNSYAKNAYKGAEAAVATIMEEVPHFEVFKKFNNGGAIQVHSWKDRKDTDFKSLVNICNHFASGGAITHILPKPNVKNAEYTKLFGSLKNTKYWRKCPDLAVNGNLYEFESWNNKKNAFSKMISRGVKQSDRIIIMDDGSSLRYIRKNVYQRIKEGQSIKELWILKDNGKLIRVI